MDKQTKKTKINPKKAEIVAELQEKLAKSKSLFLTDYRGLTHQQLESLKKTLKKVQAEFVVAKNTLMKIAFNKQQITDNKEQIILIEKNLKNPTATFFAYGDEIAAIKELAKFIKTRELPKIKIGLFAGKLATDSDFIKLASLPTREILLATLAMRLQSPLYGLHYALNWNLKRLVVVLNNVKNNKSNVKPA
jgi:large subunit ribosomal protein L10